MTKHVQKDTYYAVIFTAKQATKNEGYEKLAKEIYDLVQTQKGFIGFESVNDNKNEISVSYWETMEDIRAWSMNEHHSIAIKAGKEKWYDSFTVRICEVKREYAFGF